MLATGLERLYLDFDSFFASAEQYFNPDLRGHPVGVAPLDTLNTGCIAISREAKLLGLKSGATIRDARDLIPQMIFVVARPDAYVRLHHRVLNIIENCTPVEHVRSIDEVVCNLPSIDRSSAEKIISSIKQSLLREFGPSLTCSIGVASTELLAKIAAELHKPDGMVVLEQDDVRTSLAEINLSDIPGISEGISGRLERAGVRTFPHLWSLAAKQARALWGSVEGERFWNGLHGYHIERPTTVKRMFGHSRMLPVDWRTQPKVRVCARQLVQGASRRLRRTSLRSTKLTLSFRGGGLRREGRSEKDTCRWGTELSFLPARDDHTFLQTLDDGLKQASKSMTFAPRSVSVMLHGLKDENAITLDLFAEEPCEDRKQFHKSSKWEALSDAMDELRSAHGPQSVSLGVPDPMPGGYLGAKIAFGRIPELSDFNEQQSEDGATHFCSFSYRPTTRPNFVKSFHQSA